MSSLKIDKYTVAITSEDKILFPKSGITKGELIEYYHRVAPYMIPHIKNRPLTMHRFVHGITDEGFYQKDASDYFPEWIERAPIEKQDGGVVDYVLCNNAATLVYLTNQLSITNHVWLSKFDKLNYPDRIIFDLDPSEKDFDIIRKTALELKVLLEQLDLVPFVMTTGSRGLHVVVPIKPTHVFDEVRAFAKEIAQLLVNKHPEELTIEMRKDKRAGRVFIDYLRNAWAQTGVAPYSVRAKEDAPIATPVTWKEVGSSSLNSRTYHIKNIFRRLSRTGDIWQDIDTHAGSLKTAIKKLDLLV